MTIKQQGGIFGRNPTFNDVEVEGSITLGGSAIPDPSDTLVSSDIGSTVQGYDADTAKYDDTTANFTGTLQNGGSDVLVDTDIGSTVQGYDADTAKLDVTQTFTADQTFGQAKATNFILDAVVASNYDIKMVRVSGDGGTNTVQVYWNAYNPSGAAAAGGVIGAYDQSGNYAAPGDTISVSGSWTIYGFIGVAP